MSQPDLTVGNQEAYLSLYPSNPCLGLAPLVQLNLLFMELTSILSEDQQTISEVE